MTEDRCICYAAPGCKKGETDFLPHCRHSPYYPRENWSPDWRWNESRDGWERVHHD